MMIQLGEPEILERHMPQPVQRRIDFHRAFPNLLQQGSKLKLIHSCYLKIEYRSDLHAVFGRHPARQFQHV